MSLLSVRKNDWSRFFDRLSKTLVGKRAEVEVASLVIGAQIVVEWLPLLGIVYDPRSDVLEISLEGVEHLVHGPREVYIDDPPFGRTSLGVKDVDGALQIIRLRDPILLPAFLSPH